MQHFNLKKHCHFNRKLNLPIENVYFSYSIFTFRADVVGQCITEIVNSDKNGSVWIVHDGKTREVTLNNYFL